jgi:hypothetical protein
MKSPSRGRLGHVPELKLEPRGWMIDVPLIFLEC